MNCNTVEDEVHFFLYCNIIGIRAKCMVFKATFSNISVVSWRSVLVLEETKLPGEKHRPAASH